MKSPCKQFRQRGLTVVGWVAACACLRCALDFDRFEPVAASSGDSAVGYGTAGSDVADSSLPRDDASQRPIDGAIESSIDTDQLTPRDSAVGD